MNTHITHVTPCSLAHLLVLSLIFPLTPFKIPCLGSGAAYGDLGLPTLIPVLYWDKRKVCSQGQHSEAGLHVELAAERSNVSAVNMLLA